MATDYKYVSKGMMGTGTQVRNVFYLVGADDVSPSTVKTACQAHWTRIWDALRGLTSVRVHYYGLDCYKKAGDDWNFLGEVAINCTGEETATELGANQLAYLVTGHGSTSSGRPKKYFAGVCEGRIEDGYLTTAALSVLGNVANMWINNFTSGSLEWFPAFLKKSGALELFGSAMAQAIVSTQRRRKQGVGI